MKPLTPSETERRIIEALNQEARTAMTMTNTPQELQRFQQQAGRRKNRFRIAAAAAAAAAVVGGVVVGLTLSSWGSPSHSQVGVKPLTSPNPGPLKLLSFGRAAPLSAGTPVATLAGPQNLGLSAFGAVWATSGHSQATLYKVSADGSQVLAQSPLTGLNEANATPVQVGQNILVAIKTGPTAGFAVFDPAGQRVGTLNTGDSVGSVGDASGGWVTTQPNQIGQTDMTGEHITKRITLPPTVSTVGLATGDGLVWAIDGAGRQLLRIDPRSGTVTARTSLPSVPVQVAFTGGAVYVASQDFSLRRIDPSTMQITAAILSKTTDSWPFIAESTDGSLWVQPAKGAIDQLNPTTLHTLRAVRLFPNNRGGGTFGALVTGSRVYVTNGDTKRLYSFAP
jgi:streptogramin lyase